MDLKHPTLLWLQRCMGCRFNIVTHLPDDHVAITAEGCCTSAQKMLTAIAENATGSQAAYLFMLLGWGKQGAVVGVTRG